MLGISRQQQVMFVEEVITLSKHDYYIDNAFLLFMITVLIGL